MGIGGVQIWATANVGQHIGTEAARFAILKGAKCTHNLSWQLGTHCGPRCPSLSGHLCWHFKCGRFLIIPAMRRAAAGANSVRRTKTNSFASECITMDMLAHIPSRFLLVQSLSPSVTFIVFFRRPMGTPPFEATQILSHLWTCSWA